MKSSKLSKLLQKVNPRSVLTASLLSASLGSGMALASILWGGADEQSAWVMGVVFSIIMASMLINEDES